MEIEASKLSISLNTISVEDLLESIKSPNASEADIKILFTELYNRVKNGFYQKCRRLSETNGFDEHLAKDIFQETFLNAYKKVKFFILEEGLTEERQENTIIAWLSVIATNKFNDFIRKRIKVEEIKENDEEEAEAEYVSFDDLERFGTENESYNITKIKEALLTLDERESFILHQCNRYGCLELENKNHLPDDVIKDICKQFGIKSSYIRVIKKRAIQKIRSSCLS
jgi:RNA polymerase sigma factor (sigma-70 family)